MQKSTMPTFILFIGLRTLTYSSLTHSYMDLNMHEQCSRHLNTVPEALVVTLDVLDASAEFSPSRPALQSLSPLPPSGLARSPAWRTLKPRWRAHCVHLSLRPRALTGREKKPDQGQRFVYSDRALLFGSLFSPPLSIRLDTAMTMTVV